MDKQLVIEIGRGIHMIKARKTRMQMRMKLGHFLNFLQKYHNFIFSY